MSELKWLFKTSAPKATPDKLDRAKRLLARLRHRQMRFAFEGRILHSARQASRSRRIRSLLEAA